MFPFNKLQFVYVKPNANWVFNFSMKPDRGMEMSQLNNACTFVVVQQGIVINAF